MPMTPEKFKARLEELRTLLDERPVDLKKNPKWANDEQREELVEVLDEVGDQIDELSIIFEFKAGDESHETD
jgi:hypothetical protein